MDIWSCPALVRKDAKRSVKTSSNSVRPIKGLASTVVKSAGEIALACNVKTVQN